METSFLELRCKQVINVVDGRSLGHIIDMVIDTRSCRVLGLVLPGNRNFLNIFRTCDDIFIPFCCICKIGEDTILVEITNLPPSGSKRCRKNVRLLNKEDEQVKSQNSGKDFGALGGTCDTPRNPDDNYDFLN